MALDAQPRRSAFDRLAVTLARRAMRLGWWLPLRGWQETPSEEYLRSVLESVSPDQMAWVRARSPSDRTSWHRLRREALSWWRSPRISLLAVAADTDPRQLQALLDSARSQSYPWWQLCVVDDGSIRTHVWNLLVATARVDPRILARRLDVKGGLRVATRLAISMTNGDYVAFLDCDDLLAPDALHRIAEAIRKDPSADVLVCDQDHPIGNRSGFLGCMHLPGQARASRRFGSGSAASGFTLYRRALLERLDDPNPDLEDPPDRLIRRALALTNRVRRLPDVRYRHARVLTSRHQSMTSIIPNPLVTLGRLSMRLGWWQPARFWQDAPSEADLQSLLRSAWPDYGDWLGTRTLSDTASWHRLRREASGWRRPPRISLITATCDTQPEQLQACLDSARSQSYPWWELCIVDDASTQSHVWAILVAAAHADPRIRLHRLATKGGICVATNRAIAMARGDYIAFLDHDDLLAADALHRVAEAIRADPSADVLYSDRDNLTDSGARFMHLLKPAWSPETLLSGNYVFHLTLYRRTLLERIGGLDPDLEGSQDYDLILRAAEVTERIRHIPRVLYHWRTHEASIATNALAKPYVYESGKKALAKALQRRGFSVQVSDVPGYRGHYRAHLPPPPAERIAVARLQDPMDSRTYATSLTQAIAELPRQADLIVALGPGVVPADPSAISALVEWLQIPGVGLVTGRVVSPSKHLCHAGLVMRTDGLPLALYLDFPETAPSYMAYAAILRNVSVPHPFCMALRRELWDTLGGFSKGFDGPHAMLDLALRSLAEHWRAVYVPDAEFVANEPARFAAPWCPGEAERLAAAWDDWLVRGDPYYPVGLDVDATDMRLAANPAAPPVVR